MKHFPKAGFAVSAGPRLVAVEFEIDPPAAVNIRIRLPQVLDAEQFSAQLMRPWGSYYGWMPDPSSRKHAHLRLSRLQEAINTFNLDHLFFDLKNHTN